VIFCDYWCVVFSMGNLISIENLNDPHDQTILRGHDMQVGESSVLFCVYMFVCWKCGLLDVTCCDVVML
jgi:hypothetical protein